MWPPIQNWMGRHQDPVNFWLHMLGIPATVLAVPLAIVGCWLLAVGFFVAGYALQFIGHAVEGNDSGEALLVRRLMGRVKSEPSATPAGKPRKPR
ncbi:MAG: DUF962 domain-containing protein [Planctomycetes bacterium]|nr:DUF962 domain-containing protein [Planctomycetota bacterium]